MTRKPPQSAGACLKCFYHLLEAADSSKQMALQPLKAWIESHMEVSVKDGAIERKSIPVRLDSENFETFCTRTIESVRTHDDISGELVELHLKFKESKAA